jgi:hypothetical protein
MIAPKRRQRALGLNKMRRGVRTGQLGKSAYRCIQERNLSNVNHHTANIVDELTPGKRAQERVQEESATAHTTLSTDSSVFLRMKSVE